MKTAAYPPDLNPAGQIMNMSSPPRTTLTVSTCCTVSVKGREDIRAYLEPFVQMTTNIEWIIHQIAENDEGVVLTERTDRFEINGQWMDILVMGVMEFEDGLISNWRDYFDMKAYESETARVLG